MHQDKISHREHMPLRDEMSQFMGKWDIKYIRQLVTQRQNVTGAADLITGRRNVTLRHLASFFGSKCSFLGWTYNSSTFSPMVTRMKCYSG
jgi:hypothetical protein